MLARRFNFTHEAINETAAALRRLGHDVPKDARTILGTERKAPLEQDRTFIHFGLQKGLQQALQGKPVPHELLLQASIDGLPLWRTSGIGFWPILCRLTNCGDSTPFVVSMFCDNGKPPDLQSFLGPFLVEVEKVTSSGLFYKGSSIPVRLRAVICDAPARSFVKKIKGHTGYHGCERCCQKGLYVESRMTFPELNAARRTDRCFRDQDDPLHHVGDSPFAVLGVDMISLFPLDYMHLVCLGVMRRQLKTWVQARGSLRTAEREELSKRLRLCAKSFPRSLFQRQPRGVDEIERWKATEFRAFLLYAGPVVLRGLLPDEQYQHFLILHVAIRILASPSLHIEENAYAGRLLSYFVQEYGTLYGASQLTYNMHSLSHLAEECLMHGPLDAFSAFPFENFLGKLKPLLRTKTNPLAQVSRRLSEHAEATCFPVPKRVPHTVTTGDCYIIEKSPSIIMKVSGSTCEAAALRNVRDFFTHPLKSTAIDICRTDGQDTTVKELGLSDVSGSQQCLALPFKSGHVVFPLLHMQ